MGLVFLPQAIKKKSEKMYENAPWPDNNYYDSNHHDNNHHDNNHHDKNNHGNNHHDNNHHDTNHHDKNHHGNNHHDTNPHDKHLSCSGCAVHARKTSHHLCLWNCLHILSRALPHKGGAALRVILMSSFSPQGHLDVLLLISRIILTSSF